MPQAPKSANKKKAPKRKKRTLNVAPMGRSLGFPKERKVMLRYCSNQSLSCTTGILTYNQYRANSVFDPDYTNAGHQPMNFDQWSSLYNHYQVLGSKISIVLSPEGNLSVPHVAGIYLSDDTTTYTTWDAFQESGRMRMKNVQSIEKPITVTSSFGLRKFFTAAVDNGQTSASVSTNPNEEAFYSLILQPVDKTSSSSSAVQCRVQIDYIVRFFEPKDLAQS